MSFMLEINKCMFILKIKVLKESFSADFFMD